MLKGFKEFIAQGNALELAVAVIIGGAFSPIVDAITKVIMTILGQIIGQPNFDSVGQFKIFASADKFVQPGTIITSSCSPRSAPCSRPTPPSSESRSDLIIASAEGPADPHDRRGLPLSCAAASCAAHDCWSFRVSRHPGQRPDAHS